MPVTRPTDETGIEYETYGDGQPLILLHGGMAPREYWQPVIPQLDDYAAVVPQRVGFGTRPDALDETGPDEVLDREVADVLALAEEAGEEYDAAPVLFGHSFGALTAIETARAATAADGETGIEAVVAYEPAIPPEEFAEYADLADRMEARLDDGDREGAMKLYVEQVLHPDGVADLDAWLAEWPVWPDCVDLVEEVVRMNYAVERYELPEKLDVEVPVLVLTGTEGPDFLRNSARATHDALPHSRLVEFDGVGHGGPSEAPGRIVAETRSFLGDSNR